MTSGPVPRWAKRTPKGSPQTSPASGGKTRTGGSSGNSSGNVGSGGSRWKPRQHRLHSNMD
eukprot:847618-Heterocapsa_arctica.AAC.1